MIVSCITNSAEDLPKEYFDMGYSPSSRIHLVKDGKYRVYGISLWRGKLHYLVIDETKAPFWYPCILFSVEDGAIPSGWQFQHFNEANNLLVKAVLGYPELACSGEHFDKLMDRDENALDIFFKRKTDIDKEIGK